MPDRMHHQIRVRKPWFDSLAKGERNFELVEDRGFRVGDIVHLWEYESVPSESGPHELHTGQRLQKQVNFILNGTVPGLVFGWAVIGFGQIKTSGSGAAGAEGIPSVIPLTQVNQRERLAA